MGKIGENVEYILESDGTLTIYGYGPIDDRSWDGPFNRNAKVKNVVIHEGVTHLGSMMFHESGLVSISIPSTVTTMGFNPVSRCTSLTTVTFNNNKDFIFYDGCIYNAAKTRLIYHLASNKRTTFTIPGTVEIIDFDAFGFSSLTSLTIHDTVKEIGTYCFIASHSMASISIGKNVQKMGNNTFVNMAGLQNIYLNSANKYFKIINNAYCSYDGTILLAYLKASTATTYTIDSKVTRINDHAMSYNHYLTTLIIPASVTYIDHRSFYADINLVKVTYQGTTPPDYVETAFEAVSTSCKFYVPKAYTGGTFCGKSVIRYL